MKKCRQERDRWLSGRRFRKASAQRKMRRWWKAVVVRPLRKAKRNDRRRRRVRLMRLIEAGRL